MATDVLKRGATRKTSPETRAGLERFRTDVEYIVGNKPRLLEQYAEQWIAVYEGNVVAARKDLNKLARLVEGQGISPEAVIIDFLTAHEQVLIL